MSDENRLRPARDVVLSVVTDTNYGRDDLACEAVERDRLAVAEVVRAACLRAVKDEPPGLAWDGLAGCRGTLDWFEVSDTIDDLDLRELLRRATQGGE